MQSLTDLSSLPQLAPSEALKLGPVAASASLGVAPQAHGDSRREGFRVGSLRLMVRYEDGSELTEMPPVCRLPNAPGWFLGVANLHGSVVPVFDMASRWGCVSAPSDKPMLLVLGHAAARAGILIDGLPTRLRPTPQDRLDDAAEPSALSGCVIATHRIDGDDWIDLSCAALLERLQHELRQPGAASVPTP